MNNTDRRPVSPAAQAARACFITFPLIEVVMWLQALIARQLCLRLAANDSLVRSAVKFEQPIMRTLPC